MRRVVNTHTLAGVLIAVGIIIAIVALYADSLGLGKDDDYLGPRQWLGAGLGLTMVLFGVALTKKDRIKEGSGSLLRRAWTRLVENWPLLLAVGLTLLVTGAALFLRLHNIGAALPYPGHVDAPHLTKRAGQVIKTGSFDLQFFNYPHTPIYLVMGGLLVGYADAAMHLEVNNTQAIGSLGFPHFTQPRVIWPAMVLFATLSVVAMVFMGIVGQRAYGRRSLLWLVPLVILFSATYFYYSHRYLNVDIVGAFFVAAVYFCLFQYLDRDTVLHKSILPGAVSALALTSKYNLLWVVVPPILVILLYSQRNRIGKIFLFVLSVAIGFLLLMPDVLINFTLFVDTIAGSMFHYARGHVGSEGQPGPLQLIYYLNSIVGAYSLPTVLLAALGIGAAFQRNWKGTLVILSFPAILLLYMSAQRARFVRNIVSVHLFYGLFVALGILCAYDLVSRLLERYPPLQRSAGLRHVIVTLAFVALLALLLPVRQPLAWAQAQPDTRNQAIEWIQDHVPKGSPLLISRELGMRTQPLEEDYQVAVERFVKLTDEDLNRRVWELGDPYILMPIYAHEGKELSGKAVAQRLNRYGEGMQVLVEFPGREVLVNAPRPVPQGDPAFFIGQLELTPEQVEALEGSLELDLVSFEGRKRVEADGSLRLPWNSTLRSPPFPVREGRYEVALVTRGTEAKGANALFRVHFGDENLVGEFYSQETFQETRLTYEIAEAEKGSLIVAFVNDAAERNAAGEIVADRNAWIRSITIRRVDGQP